MNVSISVLNAQNKNRGKKSSVFIKSDLSFYM